MRRDGGQENGEEWIGGRAHVSTCPAEGGGRGAALLRMTSYGKTPPAIPRNKNESSQSQSGPLLPRHMLVGSRPSRTTLSHRLQSLLGAPCWS